MRTLLPLVLLAFVPISGKSEALTLQQSIQVRQLADLRFSPDGSRLALTVQEPVSGRRAESHLWVLETATRQLRQWTRSAKSERMPRWSPGGAALAFLSDREDSNEIWLMPVAGGEATRLTNAKQGVQSFRWSPDGRQIAFLATDPRSPEKGLLRGICG